MRAWLRLTSVQEQFKAWVDGLLNVSVPIILSKRSLRSHDVRCAPFPLPTHAVLRLCPSCLGKRAGC
jgi:hypothetical protein